jgi:hypothetical protein
MKLQDNLRNFLLNKFPDAHNASGNKEVSLRCRFCGDSSTNLRATHFYVSLGSEDKPPLYFCFKCGEKGILTPDILMALVDCGQDAELLCDLRNHNTKSIRANKNRLNRNKVYRVSNKYIRNDDLSNAKLHYINKRLGLNLTFDDMIKNKIVLNLLDLLNYNHINKYTRYDNIVKELDDSFIGFLSMNNGFINLKNLRKPGTVNKYIDLRYVNYSIFESEENSRRFYTIPTKSNILSPEPIQIHIAEGPFDILSIFYNLYKGNRRQNIYTAIGGKSYLNVIKLFLSGLGIMNCIFHLYIDNDVSDYEIKPIFELLSPIGIKLFIHRNIYPGEKDFGVKLEKIKDQIVCI